MQQIYVVNNHHVLPVGLIKNVHLQVVHGWDFQIPQLQFQEIFMVILMNYVVMNVHVEHIYLVIHAHQKKRVNHQVHQVLSLIHI